MHYIHCEHYRGYEIEIDTDSDAESPEEWQQSDLIFVSYTPGHLYPSLREGREQAKHAKYREDLFDLMAKDPHDTASEYRVFALDLNWMMNGFYVPGSRFVGEVFASEFPRNEEDEDFCLDDWVESLPDAAIVIKRGAFDEPVTTEMLVRAMETGKMPDFDELAAQGHFEMWLSWFEGEIYVYRVHTDIDELLKSGVPESLIAEFEFSDSCSGFYAISRTAQLRAASGGCRRLLDDGYGHALLEARASIDNHLAWVARTNQIDLPAKLEKVA